ncbi:MAG: DNA mismatch repair protein MutS, partial [Acidobacteria bacterium]|nr:DNA mismatch repair protein MutS [Acidobacteriota bacterium]MCA1638550.1 DNA mismatch repair protein MutS [Acidobacteriota bacterium]
MENATPMFRQYLEIKKQYPGTLLFFRLGDFYELFGADAVVGARELDITLTSRHKESKNPIPMCGVPHHAAAGYISRLVKKGFRVAICEQTEDPKKTTKLVKREVVRIITPGTAVDQQLIETNESVFLASVCGTGETFGAAFLELSTGEFFSTQISDKSSWTKICSDIESFAPRELLFPESLKLLVEESFGNVSHKNTQNVPDAIISPSKQNVFFTTLTPLDDYLFNPDECEQKLSRQLNVRDLSGFGLTGKTEAIRAAGACLGYAKETQRVTAQHISEINYFEENDFMVLDAVTLKNLEIVESRSENNKRTLLGVIDKTITGMGARLLR